MKNFALFLLALLLYNTAQGAAKTSPPYNSKIAFIDTIRVDSTNVYYSDIFWQDNGAEKMLLIEADDDSSAGFADDSAAVKIELLQVARFLPNSDRYVVMLPSHAHPDSTYPSLNFVLYDSLDIADMDTAAVWSRTAVPTKNLLGDTTGYTYNDVIGSAATGYGAFAYAGYTPDYSPGLVLKVTGLTSNKITGVGSRWIFRWIQVDGTKMKL
jgi:hypothetical protein